MTRYDCKDVVVLLPGISGSVLKKDGRVLWGYSGSSIGAALVTLGSSIVQGLALPHDDPAADDLKDGITADELMPDLHLLPGLWKIDGYTKVADALLEGFALTEGKNFFRFPYDWRRDNRVAARKLARQTHDWLKAWREDSGNADAKLVLVAHSMGGLVSRYFLECMEGWRVTRALVTFGTPYRGSLNALDSLANGLKVGPFDISALARQLTAIYQLLPIYECYDAGHGTLIRVGETSGIPNVDAVMAKAALGFHREIENAVAANQQLSQYRTGGYKIYPIVGIEQETKESAMLAGQSVEMMTTYKGSSHPGDGTVPRPSAIPIELSEDSGAMYVATRHGSLQNADAVITHLTGIISGLNLDLGGYRGTVVKSKIAMSVGDLYTEADPVIVRARRTTYSTDEAGLTAILCQRDSAQPATTQEMKAAGDWLVAEFPPQPAGAYLVMVGGADAEPAEDSFAVIDSRVM